MFKLEEAGPPNSLTTEQAINKVAINYIPATYSRTIEMLGRAPGTVEDIARHLGMTVSSTYKLISILHEMKVIRVVEWRRIGLTGNMTKVWGLGTRDVRRPPKLTPAQRSAAYRERVKTMMPREVRLGIWGL